MPIAMASMRKAGEAVERAINFWLSASSFCSHSLSQEEAERIYLRRGAAAPQQRRRDADHSEESNARMTPSAAPEL